MRAKKVKAPPKPRNVPLLVHIERRGAGAGAHKSKGERGKGKGSGKWGRHPKHKGKVEENPNKEWEKETVIRFTTLFIEVEAVARQETRGDRSEYILLVRPIADSLEHLAGSVRPYVEARGSSSAEALARMLAMVPQYSFGPHLTGRDVSPSAATAAAVEAGWFRDPAAAWAEAGVWGRKADARQEKEWRAEITRKAVWKKARRNSDGDSVFRVEIVPLDSLKPLGPFRMKIWEELPPLEALARGVDGRLVHDAVHESMYQIPGVLSGVLKSEQATRCYSAHDDAARAMIRMGAIADELEYWDLVYPNRDEEYGRDRVVHHAPPEDPGAYRKLTRKKRKPRRGRRR